MFALSRRIVVAYRLRKSSALPTSCFGDFRRQKQLLTVLCLVTHSLRPEGHRRTNPPHRQKERNPHRTLVRFGFLLVAGVGFEPHDLRVMSPTSYQTAPSRDIMVPEAGVEPVRESFSRDFKSRASANSAIPAFCDLLGPHCLYIISLFMPNVNTFFDFFEIFRFLY